MRYSASGDLQVILSVNTDPVLRCRSHFDIAQNKVRSRPGHVSISEVYTSRNKTNWS